MLFNRNLLFVALSSVFVGASNTYAQTTTLEQITLYATIISATGPRAGDPNVSTFCLNPEDVVGATENWGQHPLIHNASGNWLSIGGLQLPSKTISEKGDRKVIKFNYIESGPPLEGAVHDEWKGVWVSFGGNSLRSTYIDSRSTEIGDTGEYVNCVITYQIESTETSTPEDTNKFLRWIMNLVGEELKKQLLNSQKTRGVVITKNAAIGVRG